MLRIIALHRRLLSTPHALRARRGSIRVDSDAATALRPRLHPRAQNPSPRLDVFLSSRLLSASRSAVHASIQRGDVRVNSCVAERASRKVKAGDEIEISLREAPAPTVDPEDIPLDVVFEDDDVLVLNKQAGLVVHPTPGKFSGTLVNALLHHLRRPAIDLSACEAEDGEEVDVESDQPDLASSRPSPPANPDWNQAAAVRPGIVHRLDKGTTGLMVVAKSPRAFESLKEQFFRKTARREYLSLTLGCPSAAEGMLESRIARAPGATTMQLVHVRESGRGKLARSWYAVERALAGGGAAAVAWRLDTGRTHQIRVHASRMLHCPLLGDDSYGGGAAAAKRRSKGKVGASLSALAAVLARPALHARKLSFEHPVSRERVEFEADLPPDMVQAMARLALPK